MEFDDRYDTNWFEISMHNQWLAAVEVSNSIDNAFPLEQNCLVSGYTLQERH